MFRSVSGAALASALLAGCATSAHVQPVPADAGAFASLDCDALQAQFDEFHGQALQRAVQLDQIVGRNGAIVLGTLAFWPVLLALRPGTDDGRELASLKGREDAVRQVMQRKGCASPDDMPASQLASLPVRVGDRLAYDDRAQSSDRPRGLVLRRDAVHRDGLDFHVEPGALAWRQDLAGNVLPDSGARQLHWLHWLVRDLRLGQTLSGELVSEDAARTAELSGQVMAITEQEIDGRHFDAAVIDFTGRIAGEEGGTATLRGAMAVDRKSGVLLRLDIDSSDPGFARWRRLRNIVPAAPG